MFRLDFRPQGRKASLSDDELTRDEILRGRLVIWQPRRGYRFAVDSLLLLDFMRDIQFTRGCDLGCGSGVIALGLARARAAARVVAVELQPRLAQLARRNVAENGLSAQVTVVEVDLADPMAARAALPGAACDLVACNPPYRPLGEGSANPDDEMAIARHELRLTLADVAREARRVLAPAGRAALIYPAERLTSLLGLLEDAGLRPLRLRLVHPRAGVAANRALVEAHKGARGHLVVEPPLILYDDEGAYTAEGKRALGES